MKPIYIRTDRPKQNKIWILALIIIFIVMGVSSRILAPFAIEAWINRLTANEKGHVVKVSNVDLRLLGGMLILRDVRVVGPDSAPPLLEAGRIELSLRPGLFLGKKRSVKIKAQDVTVFLSGDVIGEVRDETLQNVKTVDAQLINVTMKEVDQNVVRTLLSLSNVHVTFDEDQVLKITTNISEGGKLSISGNRGTIKGELSGIRPQVFTKLGGDQKSLVVTAPTLTARIDGAMSGSTIQGTLLCASKDLRPLLPPVPPAPRRRGQPRVVIEPNPELLIPFTLEETLSFDFSAAAEELQRQGL